MINNNGVIQIYNKLRKYRWCHFTTGKFYSTRNKWFTIPPIIFASATSFVILDDDGDGRINHYLSASLSMLTAMISGVSMHLGYNGKSECHMMSGKSYDELITKLEIYIKFKTHKIDEIVKLLEDDMLKIKRNNKFHIPQWVFDEYRELPDEDKYYINLLPTTHLQEIHL
tara:strand:- start:262 stop:771 length:510 start_codon:yes stop_codon:yes gene_type:complete